MLFLVTNTYYGDSPQSGWGQFQDPASPVMEGIINFHNDIMVILVFVIGFVSFVLFRICALFSADKNPTPIQNVHGSLIEIIWTIIPALLQVVIALPSFALLYSIEEQVNPSLTLKVIGHQWYWSYEYSDYVGDEGISFDSYMIPDDELNLGDLRLLEVDNRVVIPVNTHLRVIVTAADVLHSWTVPSFGLKSDACPGRQNQSSLFVNRTGVFYGQCSEICGVNHGFMPIAVEVVPMKDYLSWAYMKLTEDALLCEQGFFKFSLLVWQLLCFSVICKKYVLG